VKPRVFIDGDVGTTGLQIRARLEARGDVELVRIPVEHRKETARRAEMLNSSDVAILCLPDDAAREAAALVVNGDVRLIDASTAHRTHPDWIYGLPELHGQREAIRAAKRVSNPGCYPTGFVSLVRPLVQAGLVPPGFPATVHAVSGYSGGGRGMIERVETPEAVADPIRDAFRSYALGFEHKHVEEMRQYALLENRPLFVPAIARFRQGMLVHVPLQLWALPASPSVADVHATLAAAYAGEPFVEVVGLGACASCDHIEPEALNDTNRMRLFVFGNDKRGQAVLVAQLDNLGKGASGAAVQNLNLMLGLPEGAGLA
jgi:N-acetyl-gamma-glutamyl-phosphate reductase